MSNTPEEIQAWLDTIGASYTDAEIEEVERQSDEIVFDTQVKKAADYLSLIGDHMLSRGIEPEALITALNNVADEYEDVLVRREEDEQHERGNE